MNLRFSLFVSLLLTLCFVRASQGKLVYLLQIARHGSKYPNKNVTSTVDPQSLKGQLTGVGMRQQYLLGSYLYHDYIVGQQLVSGRLNAREVQIFSSSYQRAIDSAYCQAYGLFPNSDSHILPTGFPEELLKPPFDLGENLHKQSQNQNGQPALNKGYQPPHVIVDNTIVNYCPNYGLLHTQKLKQVSKNLTTFQSQHSLQISKIVLIFNVSILQGTVPAMSDLYTNVISSIYLGRQLPKQFNDYDLKSLRFISDYYRVLIQTGNLGQTLSTPMIRFITDRFNQVQGRKTQKKFTLFSCHEQNLIQMQVILNLTSVQCLTQKWNNKTVTSLNCMGTPDFASNLLFEVHQNQETFGYDVKVKYNGEYAYLCEKKVTSCPMEEFLGRLGKYVHNDYEKQCGVPSST